jgi:hypothetical protein
LWPSLSTQNRCRENVKGLAICGVACKTAIILGKVRHRL